MITRSKWLRGQQPGGSWLLEPKGKSREDLLEEVVYADRMCCLGFECKRRGFTNDEIRGKTTPLGLETSGVPSAVARAGNLFVGEHTLASNYTYPRLNAIVADLMRDNDSGQISEPVREARIKKGFALLGVEVSFVD